MGNPRRGRAHGALGPPLRRQADPELHHYALAPLANSHPTRHSANQPRPPYPGTGPRGLTPPPLPVGGS